MRGKLRISGSRHVYHVINYSLVENLSIKKFGATIAQVPVPRPSEDGQGVYLFQVRGCEVRGHGDGSPPVWSRGPGAKPR